ncbi:MAG TPA: protein-methionine-sulfoxide reductase heme-binding subunit MsrQ [Tepidisphaeraceae bacterium]|jgi:sulfoxide reductase heme-binding subunit YedZ
MPDPRFAKLVLVVNGCVPLALLCYDASRGGLGANPVAFALSTTGMVALIFLTLSLAVTPLRKITGYNYFSHFRRSLGLFAFFYGSIHLAIYFAFDRSLNLASTFEDISRRPFIFAGMIALVLMLPLALTSTNGMIKRLGAKRWKALHRLAYVSAIMGVAHFYLLVKADARQPVTFAAILLILFALRLPIFRSPGRRSAPTA